MEHLGAERQFHICVNVQLRLLETLKQKQFSKTNKSEQRRTVYKNWGSTNTRKSRSLVNLVHIDPMTQITILKWFSVSIEYETLIYCQQGRHPKHKESDWRQRSRKSTRSDKKYSKYGISREMSPIHRWEESTLSSCESFLNLSVDSMWVSS